MQHRRWLLAVSFQLRLDLKVPAKMQVPPIRVLEAHAEAWCSRADTMNRKGEERQICVHVLQTEDKQVVVQGFAGSLWLCAWRLILQLGLLSELVPACPG